MQKGHSKWLCLSKVIAEVTLVWTDYTPGKEEVQQRHLGEDWKYPSVNEHMLLKSDKKYLWI